MARKRGFFHSVGTFFRVAVWGLAALMAVALWLSWSDRTAPPEDTTIAALPENAQGTGTADSDADIVETEPEEPDTADVAPAGEQDEDPAATVVATEDEPAEDQTVESTTAAENTDAVAVGESSDVSADPTTADTDATMGAAENLSVPTDPDATYALYDLTPRDDGIEITTSRTESGATVFTTRLVTCAPLAVGTIGEAPELDTMARTEQPELTRIVLGSTESLIAAAACARR